MDVDPKQVFANERTYIEWIQMAVTLGGVGIGLLGVSISGVSKTSTLKKIQEEDGEVRLPQIIGLILTPLALGFGLYGCWLFWERRNQIKENLPATNHHVGPVLLGITTFASLGCIFILDLINA